MVARQVARQVARFSWTIILTAIAVVASDPALAAERVDVELAAERGAPATAQQSWYKILSELGVDGLRIRSAAAGDEPEIEVGGTAARPTYRVMGILTAKSELLLPGATFSTRDSARLKKWLADLRALGPEGAKSGGDLPFGMPSAQLADLHDDLARAVGFSTKGMEPAKAVAQIAGAIQTPIVIERAAAKELDKADAVTEELKEVSSGSALAYLLRPAGLVLVPSLVDRKPQCQIMAAADGQTAWPVGWPPDGPARKVLPALFEIKPVEIEDFALSDTLDEITSRLNATLLYDHFALVRQGIDPAEIKVSVPEGRMSYAIVLRKVLGQGGLKSELRLDEAGRPLLWVTTQRSVK